MFFLWFCWCSPQVSGISPTPINPLHMREDYGSLFVRLSVCVTKPRATLVINVATDRFLDL